MCVTIVAALVAAILTLYIYRMTGDLTEAASIGDMDVLLHLLLFLTVATIIKGITTALRHLYMERFSASAGYNLRKTFINHYLHAPFSKVEEAGTGESLSIYQNDIPATERLAAQQIIEIADNFLTFVAGFVFLLFISPFYTGVSLAGAAGVMVLVILISLPIQKLMKIVSEKEAAFNGVVNDSLQNISTIAAYSLHSVLEKRYLTAFGEYVKATKRAIAAIILMIVVSFMAMFGPLVVIFTILGLAVINGHMYLTEFVAFSLAIAFSAGAIIMVAQGVTQLRESAGRAQRFIEATSHEHELQTTSPASGNPSGTGLLFKDVTFSYKDDLPAALDGASFEIEPGSKVALVGGSGSGKSTVLKLLLGLYEPKSGEILCGGQNIASIGKNDLRELFSYVPQDSFLFPESIGKNIALEDKPSDTNRLNKACTDAGILEFINSLPNKFDEELTESSENISGGQRQRIAMARAFYKNAGIILFDEATSSLDPQTETEVLGNLLGAAAGKTVLMVAHRAMSITACDKIIVMDNGKICQVGTHDELIKTSPVYQGLYGKSGVAA